MANSPKPRNQVVAAALAALREMGFTFRFGQFPDGAYTLESPQGVVVLLYDEPHALAGDIAIHLTRRRIDMDEFWSHVDLDLFRPPD